jgi:hypothetical protein
MMTLAPTPRAAVVAAALVPAIAQPRAPATVMAAAMPAAMATIRLVARSV